MSDKDWFESMPSPFDKPAATVHGTGSGEPHGYVGSSGLCGRCGHGITHWTHSKQAQMLPTPPASPTVTLDRETFDKVCAVMAKSGMLGNYAVYSNEDGDSHHHGPKRAREYHDKQLALEQEFRDALALLRAAERQK